MPFKIDYWDLKLFLGINSIPDSTKKTGQRLVGDVDYDDVSIVQIRQYRLHKIGCQYCGRYLPLRYRPALVGCLYFPISDDDGGDVIALFRLPMSPGISPLYLEGLDP